MRKCIEGSVCGCAKNKTNLLDPPPPPRVLFLASRSAESNKDGARW